MSKMPFFSVKYQRHLAIIEAELPKIFYNEYYDGSVDDRGNPLFYLNDNTDRTNRKRNGLISLQDEQFRPELERLIKLNIKKG